MNSQHTYRLVLLSILAVVLLLSACRHQTTQSGPVIAMTLTSTPRSTPLPVVATAVPAGAAENPLQMVIRPEGSMSAARSAIADFEAAVLEKSGLTIKVELVERYAEALGALCDSSGGQVTVAWLNGASYAAANAQNCGSPILQVERGTRSDAKTGEAASIIVNKAAKISTLSALKGKDFCRINYDDFYTWFAPSLILKANGLNPLTDVGAVSDQTDIPAVIKAVAAGDCDAAGIPANALDDFADKLGDAADKVTVLTTTDTAFPYAILMIPSDVQLGTRIALNDALVALSEDSTTAVKMRALLGQNAIVPVTSDDFKDLSDFIVSTRLDFSQLGN
ncbi:MAG: PhnD/SsuA/transferrin family substrate-binding protein [Chloroflexota bacterium]